MKSSELTKWQAYALKNRIYPMLGYLNRLKRRMHYKGFHRDDPLMQAVMKAEIAMHDLHVLTHYLTCPEQTGRPEA